MRPVAGSIVLCDWRGGAIPNEPTGLRPAVVVEDDQLFADYPNLLVVPLTTDPTLAHATFAVRIDPTPANGGTAVSWALAHHATTLSMRRVQARDTHVSAEQLTQIRQRIALSIGAA